MNVEREEMLDQINEYRAGIPERLVTVRGVRSRNAWAKTLGVRQQNIDRYERGQSVPHLDFLIRLALKEQLSLDWLVMGEGREKRV